MNGLDRAKKKKRTIDWPHGRRKNNAKCTVPAPFAFGAVKLFHTHGGVKVKV